MNVSYKTKIIAIIFILIADAIWLTSMKPRYDALVKNIQGSSIESRLIPAILAYILMIIGLIYIIFENVKKDTSNNILLISFKYGFIFGLVVYGIFNSTNLAIFKGYSWSMAIIDTLWGSLLFFSATYISLILTR